MVENTEQGMTFVVENHINRFIFTCLRRLWEQTLALIELEVEAFHVPMLKFFFSIMITFTNMRKMELEVKNVFIFSETQPLRAGSK